MATDPASFEIGLYSFHLSSNADCSGPFITPFDNGSTPAVRDFITNPELFRAGDVPTGSYPCVVMRINDVITFSPATTDGVCTAGTTYQADTYRVGNEEVAFKDLSGAPITATGTTTAPSALLRDSAVRREARRPASILRSTAPRLGAKLQPSAWTPYKSVLRPLEKWVPNVRRRYERAGTT